MTLGQLFMVIEGNFAQMTKVKCISYVLVISKNSIITVLYNNGFQFPRGYPQWRFLNGIRNKNIQRILLRIRILSANFFTFTMQKKCFGISCLWWVLETILLNMNISIFNFCMKNRQNFSPFCDKRARILPEIIQLLFRL